MLVYNLTSKVITYKGRKIPVNGGSVNIPTLSFIPTRDLELETARVLSFGKLPKWWLTEQALKAVAVAVSVPKEVEHKKPILLETPVTVEDKSSVTTFSKKK